MLRWLRKLFQASPPRLFPDPDFGVWQATENLWSVSIPFADGEIDLTIEGDDTVPSRELRARLKKWLPDLSQFDEKAKRFLADELEELWDESFTPVLIDLVIYRWHKPNHFCLCYTCSEAIEGAIWRIEFDNGEPVSQSCDT